MQLRQMAGETCSCLNFTEKLEIHSLLILTAEGLSLRCKRLKDCYASFAFGWSAEQRGCVARFFTVGV